MVEVVGVRFKESGKVYYFNPQGLDLNLGDFCIVEIEKGLGFGEVVAETKMLGEKEVIQPLRKVLRKANEEDYAQLKENKKKEREARALCLKKIENLELGMKLVRAKYNFDRSKIVFYFTADSRVDFRELVKELAHNLKVRIELRQIGVRDEAKMLGGFGSCGHPLCCAAFLKNFEPVSLRMVKEQNLALDSFKLSGLCGRLRCCLKYEYEAYKKMRKGLPKAGQKVKIKKKSGKVIEVNILKKTAILEFEDGKRKEVPAEELE
jgi:cell fate regulator YaaT (PSP1 superfamily)